MPQLTPLQSSFSAGELSPLLYGQTQIDAYQQGVKQALNMFPDSRGPLVGRSGTKFVEDLATFTGRVLSMPVNQNKVYAVTLTAGAIKVTSPFGEGPDAVLSDNPAFAEGLADWTVIETGPASSVTLVGDSVSLAIEAGAGNVARIRQAVTVVASTDYRIQWNTRGTELAEIRVGTTAGGSELLSAPTSNRDANLVFNSGGATTIYIEAVIASGFTNETAAELIVDYFAVDSAATTAAFTAAAPYAGKDLVDLQYAQNPDGESLYLLHPNYQPRKLVYDSSDDSFTFTAVTFTGKPAAWTGTNWPGTGTFYQSRLWLAGTRGNPESFWGSKSNAPEDFTLGSLDDDGIAFTLARYGQIVWITAFKKLLIGTAVGEHIVETELGVVTPTDIRVEQQSSYGSANVQPVQVGDQVLYVSPDRRKVRAIQFEFQADNWLSTDLTFNSEHITGGEIVRMAWDQNPDNLLYCIMRNGDKAVCTYNRALNIFGWSLYKSQGGFVDGAIVTLRGTDYLLALVRYGSVIHLEVESRLPTRAYIDAWVERLTESDGVTVNGLAHLEGRVVQVVVDGAVQPDRTVVSGSITLATAGAIARVGLGYTRRSETLPLDGGAQTGSGIGYTKRYVKIYVRVNESLPPIINGVRPPTRNPSTPMGLAESPESTDFEVVGLGYSRSATVTVEETAPVPLTVVALFGEVAQSI